MTQIRPVSRFMRFVAPARDRSGLLRTLLGLVLIGALYIGVNTGIFALFAAASGREAARDFAENLAGGSTPLAALILLTTFLPLIVATFIVVRLLHRRSPATLLGDLSRLGRDFLCAVLAMAAVFAAAFAFWSVVWDTQPNLPPGLWLALLPLACASIALQTLAEELVFRGYLVQQIAARTGLRLLWMGLPAVLFGVLHFDPTRPDGAAVAGPVAALIFALVATDLTARTGSLGAAWGMHFSNNLIAIGFIATGPALSGLALRRTPYGPEALMQSPLLLAVELLPIIVVWLILRRWLAR